MTHGLILHGEALGCLCKTWLAMGEPAQVAAAYLAHRRYRAAAVAVVSPREVRPSQGPETTAIGTAGSPSRAVVQVPAVPPSDN